MSPNGPLRTVVIGAGERGHLYAQALSVVPQVRVTSLVEPDESARKRFTRSFPDARCYATVLDLLSRGEPVDAAIIATPDFAHREASIALADRGVHLMIEKPLAMSVEDAEAIAASAAASRSRVMIGFENRWHPRFIEARQLMRDSGTVISHSAQLNDSLYVPTRMLSWAAATSPAWFLMPHTLDLAIWLGGAAPASVSALGRKGLLSAQGIDTWDSIIATFRMSDGSFVSLQSSWTLPETIPAVFEFRYEIQTERSLIRVDGANQGIAQFTARAAAWPQLSSYGPGSHGIAGAMIEDFVRYASGADVDVPTVEDGLTVTRAIEAVHKSLKTGSTIAI